MIKEFDFSTLDLDALAHPNDDFFKVFKVENSPEFFYKIQKFAKMLQERYLYLSDEYRNPEVITAIISDYFQPKHPVILYEMGNFQGLIGFTDIMPGYKASMLFKIWDKNLYSKGMVRACKGLLEFIQDSLNLRRISTGSPDPRMVKGAKMIGFKVEGEKECGFMWDGKFYTDVLLSRIQQEE